MAGEASEAADHRDNDQEQRIREKAYQLWQEDGAPEGKADEYWHRARALIEDQAKSVMT